MTRHDIRGALRSLIRGEGVRRASHDLLVEGEDVIPIFERLLEDEGFRPMRIDEIDIRPGERIPAFYLEGRTAHFGWVFWEVFFPGRMRKIFGSVVRNDKGDWRIILGRGSRERVYADISAVQPMDVDRPSEF